MSSVERYRYRPRIALAALSALALMACADFGPKFAAWEKPGATEEDLEQALKQCSDSWECMMFAGWRQRSWRGEGDDSALLADRRTCRQLDASVYSRIGTDRSIDYDAIFYRCMFAKGWRYRESEMLESGNRVHLLWQAGGWGCFFVLPDEHNPCWLDVLWGPAEMEALGVGATELYESILDCEVKSSENLRTRWSRLLGVRREYIKRIRSCLSEKGVLAAARFRWADDPEKDKE